MTDTEIRKHANDFSKAINEAMRLIRLQFAAMAKQINAVQRRDRRPW